MLTRVSRSSDLSLTFSVKFAWVDSVNRNIKVHNEITFHKCKEDPRSY